MIKYLIAVTVILVAIAALPLYGAEFGKTVPAQAGLDENSGRTDGGIVSDILNKLENRYTGESFSADFYQESTLSALDISDTAEGKAWFKHPGKMRWEYETPDRHIIVTDGETLWIHRPEENQVVKGEAASYFGDGKGASFLADFSLVEKSFDVSLENKTDTYWHLKLVPHEKQYELSAIYIEVNRQTKNIDHVTTENVYDDTTTISFENMEFSDEADDSLFTFEIPQGTDIIYMDE